MSECDGLQGARTAHEAVPFSMMRMPLLRLDVLVEFVRWVHSEQMSWTLNDASATTPTGGRVLSESESKFSLRTCLLCLHSCLATTTIDCVSFHFIDCC